MRVVVLVVSLSFASAACSIEPGKLSRDGTGGAGAASGGAAGGTNATGGSGGGVATGGTGGTSTGGIGTGGSGTGGNGMGGNGMGGNGTGGNGTGATGGVPDAVLALRGDLRINEVRTGSSAYLELHNARVEPVELMGLYLVVEDRLGIPSDPVCDLSSGTVPAEGVYLAQHSTSGECDSRWACDIECNLPLQAGTTVRLLAGSGNPATDFEIDAWDVDQTYQFTDSLQACPDGGTVLTPNVLSPGESNAC